MSLRSILTLACAALSIPVLAATASARPVAGEGQAPRAGGTVVVGLVPEPPSLNMWVPPGSNSLSAGEVVQPTMDSGLRLDARVRPRPLLLEGQPRIVRRNPFTIRFSYKQAARWNDGTPVTGHDLVFAWRANPEMGAWGHVRRVQVSGRGAKTVTMTFRQPVANWRWAAGWYVLPRHALEGETFAEVWRTDLNNPKTGRSISNGPFEFESWERGRQIVLVRNRNYWGRRAYVERIVYRVFSDGGALVRALRSGEVDLIFGAANLPVADVVGDRRLRVLSGPAYSWEHLEFQQGPQGHPALKQRYVRQALAAGINRLQVARGAYGSIAVRLPVLQNAIYKPFEPQYRPNWAVHRFNQRRAIDLLRRNGCTGGPARPGAGGIYSCPGVGELSFRFTTTIGNPARELAFRIMRTQLRSVGIELQPNLVTPAQFTGGVISGGNWDIVMFSFAGSPMGAANSKVVHGCGGTSNFARYCNRTVTRLLEQVETTVDDGARATLLNRADALMAQDVPLLPLFSLPSFVVHQPRLRGVVRTPVQAMGGSQGGNPAEWWLAP
jgi:peptide/nickel transport system substrate-binding protein